MIPPLNDFRIAFLFFGSGFALSTVRKDNEILVRRPAYSWHAGAL
jgi:hypothetical protein